MAGVSMLPWPLASSGGEQWEAISGHTMSHKSRGGGGGWNLSASQHPPCWAPLLRPQLLSWPQLLSLGSAKHSL